MSWWEEGGSDKSRQCWQCQAPVTKCPAGLAGIREGKAPETQGQIHHSIWA